MPIHIRDARVVDEPSDVALARCVDEGRGVGPNANDAVLVSGSVGKDERKPRGASVKGQPSIITLPRTTAPEDNTILLATGWCFHHVHMPAGVFFDENSLRPEN